MCFAVRFHCTADINVFIMADPFPVQDAEKEIGTVLWRGDGKAVAEGKVLLFCDYYRHKALFIMEVDIAIICIPACGRDMAE